MLNGKKLELYYPSHDRGAMIVDEDGQYVFPFIVGMS